MVEIEIDDAWKKRLGRVKSVLGAQGVIKIMRQAGEDTGALADEIARQYPAPSHKPLPKTYVRDTMPLFKGKGKPGGWHKVTPFKSKFASPAQAFKVMNLAEAGQVPYQRHGTLANSMTYEVNDIDNGNGVEVVIGSNVPYAKQVLDMPAPGGKQSRYHAGTWIPLFTRMNENRQRLVSRFENSLRDGIKAALKRN